jgi:hypothetical protein
MFDKLIRLYSRRLDLEALDLVLEGADLAHQVRGFVGRDAGSNNGPGNTASTAEGHLGRNVDVWNVLVFAEERQVEKDSKRGGVGGEDDQLADTTVEGLGGLVGTLLQLPVVGRLLNEIKNLLRQSLVGLGPCGAVVLGHFERGSL